MHPFMLRNWCLTFTEAQHDHPPVPHGPIACNAQILTNVSGKWLSHWIAWLMFPGDMRSLARHGAIMGRCEEQVWRRGESLHLRGKKSKSYRDRT